MKYNSSEGISGSKPKLELKYIEIPLSTVTGIAPVVADNLQLLGNFPK